MVNEQKLCITYDNEEPVKEGKIFAALNINLAYSKKYDGCKSTQCKFNIGLQDNKSVFNE